MTFMAPKDSCRADDTTKQGYDMNTFCLPQGAVTALKPRIKMELHNQAMFLVKIRA